MMAQAFVGTSGWSYRHWVGDLYPAGVPSREWLGLLARRFDTVELNVSFYRLLPPEMVRAWTAMVPPGFRFAAKLWRMFTHWNPLEDPEGRLPDYVRAIREIPAANRGPILVQLPPSMKADPERLDRFLVRLRRAAPRWRFAVEFRHPSWFDAGIMELMDHRRAAVCVHDMAHAAPNAEPNDAPFVYVRRHGPKPRYQGSYSDRQVAADAEDLRRWLDEGRDVFWYYNNDRQGNALRDADRLKGAASLPSLAAQGLPFDG